MIFLKDNVRLERDLQFEDIKPRLLGHWGTCPGLTLVYVSFFLSSYLFRSTMPLFRPFPPHKTCLLILEQS